MRGGLWFFGFLALSAAAHIWLLGSARVGLNSSPARAEVLTSVEIVEEAPSELPPAPPPPEPGPAAEPPQVEEILAAPDSETPAESVPRPTPAPTPEATPPPRPKATPVPRPPATKPTSTKPPASAVPDRAVPVVLRNSPPRYPEFARRKGWEGLVVVRVVVDASGRPTSAKVQSASGFGVLDQAALQTVKSWQFRPRVVGGTPVEGTVDVPVNFSLRGRQER